MHSKYTLYFYFPKMALFNVKIAILINRISNLHTLLTVNTKSKRYKIKNNFEKFSLRSTSSKE